MRAFEFLAESSGGIARRWIEKQSGKDHFFLDKAGERWNLVDVSFYPPDPDLAYEPQNLDQPADPAEKTAPQTLEPQIATTEAKQAVLSVSDQIEKDITQHLSQLKITLHSRQNFGNLSPTAKSGAAMLVIVSNGKENHGYVKYYKSKKTVGDNPLLWQNTDFLKNTGLTIQTPQMKKAGIKIDPADLVQPQTPYTDSSVIQTVASNIKNLQGMPEAIINGVGQLINNVKEGQTKPVPGLAEFQTAIEIKLGEIAAPVALASGNLVSGSYQQAEQNLIKQLGGKGWVSASAISFPDRGEQLVDSYLHFPDGKVGISSKDAKGGAKPSIKTVVDTIQDPVKKKTFSPEFFTKNADVIDILTKLHSESAIEGVMNSAERLKIVASGDIDWLKSIYGKGKDVEISPTFQTLIKNSAYQNVDTAHREYQPGYHILAVLARAVVDVINQDVAKVTDFFKAVLNKSNLVQVYAKTSTQDDSLYFSNFKVVWPPVFEGNIQAYAGHYTSRTRPTRKISFEFK